MSPKTEWGVIDGEASSIGKLILGYAAILALIAPLAMVLNLLLTPFGSYIFSATGLLIKILIIIYLLALATPVLLGFAIDLLASRLGGTKNSVQAMKLAVYSGTAFWVAALGLILSPWLWVLIGIGYGGYLIWLGLPILMKVPNEKAQAYTAAAVGIWVIIWIVLQQVAWRMVFSSMMYGATSAYM
jgi:hypothetical protein